MEIKKESVGKIIVSTRISTDVKEELDEICEANDFKQAEFIRVAIMESVVSFKAREIGKRDKDDDV